MADFKIMGCQLGQFDRKMTPSSFLLFRVGNQPRATRLKHDVLDAILHYKYYITNPSLYNFVVLVGKRMAAVSWPKREYDTGAR